MKPSAMLVFDYCEHDFEGLMRSEVRFSVIQAKRVLHSVLLGLNHLHKQHIIHRDLKSIAKYEGPSSY